MHVVFFTEDFPEAQQAAGGLRVSIRRQAVGLAERHRVTVVVLRRFLPPIKRYAKKRILENASQELSSAAGREGEATGKRTAAAGLRVLRYSYFHLPVVWPISEPLQLLALGLWALLRHARDADLLHGHCIYAMGVPAVLLAKALGRRSVATAYGTDLYVHALSGPRPVRWWARRVLAGATRAVGVSRSLLATFASLGVGEDRRRLVPSGVDTERFHPAGDRRALRQTLDLPPGAHVFLSPNLFIPQKGHTILVEAFRRLCERRPESYLVMTADGPLRGDIADRVAGAGLSERVRFTGLLDHDAMPRWIAAADALVLPSLDEGMPLVVLEGFASGTPVVGTTAGGIPELVSDDSLGILVAPADPHAFARAMEEVMDRNWDTAVLRSRAEAFGWPSVVDRLAEVYREIIPSC